MSEVVVLRLSVEDVERGRLVGRAEAVASGRTVALRVGDDPVAVVLALLSHRSGTGADRRAEADERDD